MNNTLRNLLLVALAVVAGYILAQPAAAQAHVLLADRSGGTGAILHVTPDDDPIAGEPSSLFFDIQSRDLEPQAVLQVNGQATSSITIPASVSGNTVSASYVFPERGAYTLSLTVTEAGSGRTTSLTHAQRVSRGATGSPLDNPTYAWAEALLVATVCAFLVLAILFTNNRQHIASSSK